MPPLKYTCYKTVYLCFGCRTVWRRNWSRHMIN